MYMNAYMYIYKISIYVYNYTCVYHLPVFKYPEPHCTIHIYSNSSLWHVPVERCLVFAHELLRDWQSHHHPQRRILPFLATSVNISRSPIDSCHFHRGLQWSFMFWRSGGKSFTSLQYDDVTHVSSGRFHLNFRSFSALNNVPGILIMAAHFKRTCASKLRIQEVVGTSKNEQLWRFSVCGNQSGIREFMFITWISWNFPKIPIVKTFKSASFLHGKVRCLELLVHSLKMFNPTSNVGAIMET